MNSRLLSLLLILVGAVGLLLALLFLTGEGALPGGGSGRPEAQAPGQLPATRPAAPAESGLAATAPARVPLGEPGTVGVRCSGVVVTGGGVPVAGARVEAMALPPAGAEGIGDYLGPFLLAQARLILERAGRGPLDQVELSYEAASQLHSRGLPAGNMEPHATSDDQGRFTLSLPWPRAWLRARAPGLATGAPKEAVSREPVVLVLHPAGTIRVEVREAGKGPLAACPVRLIEAAPNRSLGPQMAGGFHAGSFREGTTDAAGVFAFEGLLSSGTCLVVALPDGRARGVSAPVVPAAGQTIPLILELEPARLLEVDVRDEEGKALAGAKVTCIAKAFPLEAVPGLDPLIRSTDLKGRAAFPGLPPGEYIVQAACPMREPADGRATLGAAERTLVELELPAGASLEGRVVDPEGRPVADALVGLSAMDGMMGMDFSAFMDPVILLDLAACTRSDENGRFRLGGLPARRLALVAGAPGFARLVRKGLRLRPGTEVTLTLVRSGGVAGKVVARGGGPVARFRIQVYAEGTMGLRRLLAAREFDSPPGEFLIDDLAPGPCLLRVESAGLAAAEVKDLSVEAGELCRLALAVALEPEAAVAGQVLDVEGRPAAGVEVSLYPRQQAGALPMTSIFGAAAPACWSGQEGRFRLAGIQEGAWRLEARAGPRGRATLAEPVLTVPGRTVEGLQIRLEKPAGLQGVVYDEEGGPQAGASLIVQRIAQDGFSQEWARTDKAGRFALAGLEPGQWQVMAMGLDFMGDAVSMQRTMRKEGTLDLGSLMSNARITRVQLRPGETATVTLGAPAGSGGALAGLVRQAGAPLSGAMVVVHPRGEEGAQGNARFASTGKEGEFRLAGLEPGEYEVMVQARFVAGRTVERVVRIEAGAEARLTVDFGGGAIRGRLVPLGRCPAVGGRLIVVHGEGGKEAGVAFTDAEGAFRIDGLGPGSYEVATWTRIDLGGGVPVGRVGPVVIGEGGGEEVVEISVQMAGVLRGVVTGAGAAGAEVAVRVEGWQRPFTGKADGAGLFRVGGLPPGPVQVEARAGVAAGAAAAAVVPGEETFASVGLKPKAAGKGE